MPETDLADLVRRMKNDIINRHDPAAAVVYYAADFTNRNPIPGRKPGLVGLIEALGEFLTAFPDAHETVETVIAAGDQVAAVGTLRATHRAPFGGVPATGRSVRVQVFELHRVVDGKIQEGWVFLDMMGLMAQLRGDFELGKAR
jgi:steroid delta-isomerase-like uncharacterized protein